MIKENQNINKQNGFIHIYEGRYTIGGFSLIIITKLVRVFLSKVLKMLFKIYFFYFDVLLLYIICGKIRKKQKTIEENILFENKRNEKN